MIDRQGLLNLEFVDFKLFNKNGQETNKFYSGDSIKFKFSYK